MRLSPTAPASRRGERPLLPATTSRPALVTIAAARGVPFVWLLERVAVVRDAYVSSRYQPFVVAKTDGAADDVYSQRTHSLRTHLWDDAATARQGWLRLRQGGHEDEGTSWLLADVTRSAADLLKALEPFLSALRTSVGVLSGPSS